MIETELSSVSPMATVAVEDTARTAVARVTHSGRRHAIWPATSDVRRRIPTPQLTMWAQYQGGRTMQMKRPVIYVLGLMLLLLISVAFARAEPPSDTVSQSDQASAALAASDDPTLDN